MLALLTQATDRAALADRRDQQQVDYSVRDAALSAFACFFFQSPSLLAFQRLLESKTQQNNLRTLFGVEQMPSDTQLRDILDGLPYEPYRRLIGRLFERFRRSGWASEFKTSPQLGSLYPVALDGSEYYSSTAVSCEHCLRSGQGDQTRFSHTILAATLIKPRSHQVLPLDAEPVLRTDGTEKQDCELTAAKRLLPRFRREHPKLGVVLLGDAIYAHEPLLALCQKLSFHYVFVVKEGSQPATFDWVEDLERQGGWVEHGQWSEGAAVKRRQYEYRICRQVPVSEERKAWVTCFEVWERDSKGTLLYHNSWVTDLEVTAETIRELFWVGRGRWKIENEQFNVAKNGGYHLEHNFGHGHKTLSTLFYFLNLLAFVTHRILERSDARYRRCREKWPLRDIWTSLREWVRVMVFRSWGELIERFQHSINAGP